MRRMSKTQASAALEAVNLTAGAQACLRDGDPAAAVWRLMDAAVLAWEAAGRPGALVGVAAFTGRGAALNVMRKRGCVRCENEGGTHEGEHTYAGQE